MTYDELTKEIKKRRKQDELGKSSVIRLKALYLESKRQEGAVCEKCGRKDNLTLDHIIPLEMLMSFGMNYEQQYAEENLRILCRTCNHFKGRQFDFSTPKTKELLLKYLEKL